MRAGSLKDRIYIYKLVKEESEYGNEKLSYQMKTSCRAALLHNPYSRTQDVNEVFYANSKRLQTYAYVDILTSDRISYKGLMYQIESIDDEPDYLRKNLTVSLINQ